MEHGSSERGIIFTGLRGMGKTVLLNEFRAAAEHRNWIVAKVEAGTDRPLRVLLAQSLNQSLRAATGRFGLTDRLRKALGAFKAFTMRIAPDGSLSLGIDVEPTTGRADTGDLELDLTELAQDLAETARHLGVGVLVLVDEMQDLDKPEIAALAAAGHEAGQRGLPFTTIGTGLPNLPTALREAKSYAGRLFEYRQIGPLDPEAAEAALVRPAEQRDVRWEVEAAKRILAVSSGYPYFVQVYGKTTWDFAKGSPIDVDDAEVGAQAGLIELDLGLYGSRWEDATPAQKAYLRAVAQGGHEPSPTADVAARMHRKPNEVSVARDELIRKGLLYAPERGMIAFTVPGMAEFIARRVPEP